MQVLALLAVSVSWIPSTSAAPAQAPVPYPPVTNTRREVVNFNAEAVRALAFAPDGSLYTINTHASQLVWHVDLDGVPDGMAQTVLHPVSIATWGNDRLLVVGAGTHALALHDRTTLDVLDVLQLPSQPADIVIDADLGCALVSCQGADVVVKVDLATFGIVTQYPIPAERPRFLFFDPGAAGTADDRVIAAAFLSGNGTTIAQPAGQGERFFVADPFALGVPSASPPDEDLFSIDVNGTGAAAVTAVKRRVGTLLTAHGKHPDGTYWALNVNSLNADPLRQSEPALRGDFVRNQAWRGALSTPANFASAAEQVDLDLVGGAYSAATATAFPFGIAFAPPGDGRVYVTSPLDDCVSIRDALGVEIGRINLPAGSIPFDVELYPFSNDLLFTYCWGSNQVLAHVVSNPALVFPLRLGLDPTPAPIRRGREIWYDGHRSRNARTSCNSCHPGGQADFIGWQISDEPSDRKDVMVTQSLLGIEDTFPYHWRGERALIDFNGAFVDLLGGPAKLTEGPGSEFEDFQAFVFSLQPHANPRAPLERNLPDAQEIIAIRPTGTVRGNPAQGVAPFMNVIGFNGQTCAECHVSQSGTNGDFLSEAGTEIPSVHALEVAHLRELRHKDQPVVSLGGFAERARSGFGIAHNGFSNDLLEFIDRPLVFQLTQTEAQNVTAFVRRFDQGISPAAHAALMLDVNHLGNAGTISGTLEVQAGSGQRWIDVVAFGRFVDPLSGQPKIGRWWFNPSTSVYDCNDTNVPSQPLSTFVTQATAGQCAMAFLGVPPGSGFRFALDPDHDLLIDSKEWVEGTSAWNPDHDGDGQPDGYEIRLGSDPKDPLSLGVDNGNPTAGVTVDFKTASMAKVEVLANEVVRVKADFQRAGGPVHTSESPVFGRLTTLALQGLEPSTPASAPMGAFASVFSCTLTLTDLSGNTGTIVMTPFTAGDMLHPLGIPANRSPLLISALSGVKSSGASSMTISGQVDLKQRFFDASGVNASAVGNRVVVLHVIRETAANTNLYAIDSSFTTSLGTIATSLTLSDLNGGGTHVLPPSVLPGSFLLTPVTGSAGTAVYDATVNGLNAGERVRIRVVGILEPHPTVAGAFLDSSISLYHLPPTEIQKRGLEFQFP